MQVLTLRLHKLMLKAYSRYATTFKKIPTMWKLFSLAVVLGVAAILWFRIDGAEPPQDAPSSSAPAANSTGSVNSGNDADKASGKTGTSGGKPNANANSGKPTQAGTSGGKPDASASSGKPAQASGRRGGGRPAPLVVTRPVTQALINDRLKAVGSGTALASVSVVPLSGGILTDVLVSSGNSVTSGDVLATLDNESELIARDRAARTAADAATDAARLTQLLRSNTTTEVELDRAKAALADADLALREAQLTFERRTVTAPISGIVGLVPVDKGNYVTTQTELATIDDRSTIIVEFWIPESFANQVSIDQPVEAIALANPSKKYQGVISGIGSRIETDSRTLPMQARLDNQSDSLRPGMSFELQLRFGGQEYPAVNPLAIQWDSKGSYIWRIVDKKAERVSVTIIQRNPESVLVDADLAQGDAIVIEGLLSLRPGATVRTAGGKP